MGSFSKKQYGHKYSMFQNLTNDVDMNNPIITKLQSQIQDPRTAEYFSEVLSCYYSGNLRSAVVMLYATVICDLIYKLEDLKNIYGDKGAAKILQDLENLQKENPKNTDWERDIPEKCKDANKILTTADYSNFCSLQQLCHLCAHPVITDSKELYRPNSDIVLGHIRNMLDGVLTKPAFQVKELFMIILQDMASVKNILLDAKQLEKYIVSKYLGKFNDVNLEQQIFRNLWKLVFALNDENCKENRNINYFVLKLLVRRHKDAMLNLISKNQDYFAKHIVCYNHEIFSLFLKFLNEFSEFFAVLPQSKQIEINAAIDSDQVYDFKAIALFRCSDAVEHILNDALTCSHSTLLYLADYLDNNAGHAIALKYYILLYENCHSFDTADWRFDDFIAPHIGEFSEDQLVHLIEATESNGQIHCRIRAGYSNKIIKKRMLAINPNFDFSKYPHFK